MMAVMVMSMSCFSLFPEFLCCPGVRASGVCIVSAQENVRVWASGTCVVYAREEVSVWAGSMVTVYKGTRFGPFRGGVQGAALL